MPKDALMRRIKNALFDLHLKFHVKRASDERIEQISEKVQARRRTAILPVVDRAKTRRVKFD